MTTIETRAAIQTFIEATNRGDAEAFAAAFTHDADLNDWAARTTDATACAPRTAPTISASRHTSSWM
ncbi:hypothetical protein AB0E01_03420 [Nocardia vinacea]|uniref:hypothetical protein n=1 Tax=Nocardia vinacea TaxID=96468 RepID=UPI0033E47D89